MSESVKKLIESKKVVVLSLDDIIREEKYMPNSSVTNSFFDAIKFILYYYQNGINFNALFNYVLTIEHLLSTNPEIDRKDALRNLKGIYAKIEDISLDNKISNRTRKRLYKFRKRVEHLEDEIEIKNSNSYCVIMKLFETRNIEYIEKIFAKSPFLVSIKDKNGSSLCKNIYYKYIDAIEDLESNSKDIKFYEELLKIIYNTKDFKLSFDEKKLILKKLERKIEKLDSRDKLYKEKENYYNKIFDKVTDKKEDKDKIISDLEKKYSISFIFPKDILESSKNIKNVNGIPLIDKEIISIDAPKTRAVDDGISCEKLPNGNYLVGVYITDVLARYDINSPVVKEALKRVKPIWITSSTKANLFPDDILTDISSLNEGKMRPALCFFYEISKDKELISTNIIKGKIINKRQTNFKDIDEEIKLGRERKEIDYFLDITDGKGESKSDYFVSYFMTLTNNEVGRYMYDNGYPAVYLKFAKDCPGKEICDEIKKCKKAFLRDDYKTLYDVASNETVKTVYGLEPDIIELETFKYAPVTSPLRKAFNILNMYALDECYFKDPTRESIESLNKFLNEQINYMNSELKNIDEFKREYKSNKVLELK